MRFKLKHLFILAIWPYGLVAETADPRSAPALLCPINHILDKQYIAPERFDEQKKDETRISAEKIENAASNITSFKDKVLIERNLLRVRADSAIFNRDKQQLSLQGNIHIDSQNMAINGSSGWLNLENNSAEFNNNQYFFADSNYQGKASTLSRSNNSQTILTDSVFSSCPATGNTGDEDWYLKTSYLELNHDSQLGIAKHAVLRFKNVPIFYTPYLSFPLGDERRSGFLIPSIADSSSRSTEINVPWYWNIASNHDVLFTPRYMKKRGGQLNADYRYLTHNSSGKLNMEYLDNDKVLQQSRHLINFNNHTNIAENIDLDITGNDVSDNDYLDDLGGGINITNTTHLTRSARLNYYKGPWKLSALAQSFKTIDDDIIITSRPYRRLPQIQVSGKDSHRSSGIEWKLNAEWVDFTHESTSKSTGSRLDLHPEISLPWQANAWFITPAIGYQFSQYNIVNGNNTEINIDDRKLASQSLDAGLFFERKINDNIIQTLEPRIFYLHVPYTDQSSIPLFDTSEYDFSFAQLFRKNRFSGVDRIADSDQITVAVSSRFLGQNSGTELLNMSIGQIFYNQDRKVSLDNSIESQSKSDLVAEITQHQGNWSSRANIQWNIEQDKTDKTSAQLRYQNQSRKIFNIGYRFRRDFAAETLGDRSLNLRQTDLALSWPINKHYSLLGRWNYSITDKRNIETLYGLEYESCCWAMRLVSQRYLQDNDNDEPYNASLMFQLILKGLGSVSNKGTTDLLKHAILGYQSDY